MTPPNEIRVPADIAAELGLRFTYHPPVAGQLDKYEHLRSVANGFAHYVASVVPPGREQATAITKIEEAMFWANAGIARQPAKDALKELKK